MTFVPTDNEVPENTVVMHYDDSVYMRIECSNDIAFGIKDHFTFRIPNAQFHPLVKKRRWDGNIRLFNPYNKKLYSGLWKELSNWAVNRNHKVLIDPRLYKPDKTVTPQALVEYAESLSLTSNGKKIFPRDYQLNAIYDAMKNKRRLIVSPTGCHAKGEKVLMFDGQLKNVEDISIGDLLMGPDNLPREVLKLYHGKDCMFRISCSRNDDLIVNADHILCLRQTQTNKLVFLSVEDYISKSKWFKHTHYLVSNELEIEFSNKPPVSSKLSPYFVGVYLGDGHTHSCAITTQDAEIVAAIYETIQKFPGMYVRASSNGSLATAYHMVIPKKDSHRSNPIVAEFSKLGLIFTNNDDRTKCEDKFIPDELKFGSSETRKELLAGIIDSDGCLSQTKTYYDICCKSKQLIDDVSFVARSLGLVVRKSDRRINEIQYHRCCIMGDIWKIPTRIPHKKILPKTYIKNQHNHKVQKVEYIGKQDFFGFELSDDRLYLTENFLVNHNSGKSLNIYIMTRMLLNKLPQDKKILILVPTVGLVNQLYADFNDYSANDGSFRTDQAIHRIFAGKQKESSEKIWISTWQSIYKNPKAYFNNVGAIICDEVHLAAADSIKGIMEKLNECDYRIGLTGTLAETKCNTIVLTGLFGIVKQYVKTNELIEQEKLSPLEIHAINLKHPRPGMKLDYQQEIKYLISHEDRNRFIVELALQKPGENTLVLFNYVEKHGIPLYERICDTISRAKLTQNAHLVYGDITADEREQVRTLVSNSSGNIIVASYGVFQTGINIPNLHNIIFASPSKSRIRVLQSIGRQLRKHPSKKTAYLYDLGDDLGYSNFTKKHMAHRLKIYEQEKFPYKIINITL